MKRLVPALLSMITLSTFAAEPAAPHVVACVGDSITYGHGSSDRARTSYPAQLQKLLGEGWSVLNFGHNARTALNDGKEFNGTPGMGYRSSPEFRKALDSHPDVVLFMLGTNDSKPVNWDGHSDEVKRDYAALVADFQALDPAPIVVIGLSPFVKKDSFSIRERIVGGELVPWQRSFAQSGSLPTVDAYAATKAAADTAYIGDGVHPNDRGYGILAEAFAAKLRELEPQLAARRTTRLTATPANAPRLEFGADGAFAVLHVTDVQDRAALSQRSADVLRAALAAARPDLVILTGDNVDGGANGAKDFAAAMEPLVALFEEFRTPFCVTFGNHDSEKKGEGFLTRQEQYDWLKKRGGALFVDHDRPSLTGVGSGCIDLVRPGRAAPDVRLFVMDSGDYSSGGYDGCHADQIEWYENVAGRVPHLWFQHIIVPDANDTGLFRAAKEGEKGVRMRVRGVDVQAVPADGVLGELKEHTCPPGWGAYRDREHTVEGRTLYEAWVRNGHMVGAYFGHDHMNTFDGIDENGIRLGATKALTVRSYNDGDPGVRLLVIHPDGSFETEHATEKHPFPVSEDGKPYRPAAPQRLPRVAPPPAEPFPTFPSPDAFAPTDPTAGGLFRPGLLEEAFGQRRVVPGPVQALANKNGTVASPPPGVTSRLIPFADGTRFLREPLCDASLAHSWDSGEAYRYRGQVFATKEGTWRFAERMWDATTVKLDGRTVFENHKYETADCSDAIPVTAGWHEIEIVFKNENGRAGAAWPDYNDKGAPTGPGFGLRTDGGPASTDPKDFFYPEDCGDGRAFRVPVNASLAATVESWSVKDGKLSVSLRLSGSLPHDMAAEAFFYDPDNLNVVVAGAELPTIPRETSGTVKLGDAAPSVPSNALLRLQLITMDPAVPQGRRLILWTPIASTSQH